MKMTCQRALEALTSLAAQRPAFTAAEIEELLAAGLALEADPRDVATLAWLAPAIEEHTGCLVDDPEAVLKLGTKLAELTEHLKSDWFRFTHSKDKLAQLEEDRRLLRRAFAVLSDPRDRERLLKILSDNRTHGDPAFTACPALGSEVYAVTRKGARVGSDLQLRIGRFADQPFSAFLKAFDKADTKMAAFSTDISTIANRIGPVRKNAHQVVIGLVKTGLPPAQALGIYHDAMNRTNAPDVAVTVARNAAAAAGSAKDAAQRLQLAQRALRHAGITMSDVAMGAAKSLLPFEPLETGAARFVELARLLEQDNLTRGDQTLKSAARMMPADGTPEDAVRRALIAYNQLPESDRESRTATAVALAAMVRDDTAIAAVVPRFLALHDELLRRRVSLSNLAAGDALECLGCPGTPAEVVETVHALVQKLAAGRSSRREDVAIAVAFAKRFAY